MNTNVLVAPCYESMCIQSYKTNFFPQLILNSHLLADDEGYWRECCFAPPAWCHVSAAGGRQKRPSSGSSGSKSGLCGWRGQREESTSGWRMWRHKLHRETDEALQRSRGGK